MRRFGRGPLALLVLVAAVVAHGAAGGAIGNPPPASAPAAAPPARLTHADSAFLRAAAEAGLAEVEGSKLAQSKGVNTQVKGFAQQMVDAHAKVHEGLVALAAAKGVALPTQPSLGQRTRLRLLAARDGAAFDRQYAGGMGVKAHETMSRLFRKAAQRADDADVRAFAAKTLPTVEQHLTVARELKATVDKEGNARAPGDRKQ